MPAEKTYNADRNFISTQLGQFDEIVLVGRRRDGDVEILSTGDGDATDTLLAVGLNNADRGHAEEPVPEDETTG